MSRPHPNADPDRVLERLIWVAQLRRYRREEVHTGKLLGYLDKDLSQIVHDKELSCQGFIARQPSGYRGAITLYDPAATPPPPPPPPPLPPPPSRPTLVPVRGPTAALQLRTYQQGLQNTLDDVTDLQRSLAMTGSRQPERQSDSRARRPESRGRQSESQGRRSRSRGRQEGRPQLPPFEFRSAAERLQYERGLIAAPYRDWQTHTGGALG